MWSGSKTARRVPRLEREGFLRYAPQEHATLLSPCRSPPRGQRERPWMLSLSGPDEHRLYFTTVTERASAKLSPWMRQMYCPLAKPAASMVIVAGRAGVTRPAKSRRTGCPSML